MITEAEFDAKMLASSLLLAVLESLLAILSVARSLSSTLDLISLALALVFSSAQDGQALEFILVGQAVALKALEALALMLSSRLGLISLVLDRAQHCAGMRGAGAHAPWPSGGAKGARRVWPWRSC